MRCRTSPTRGGRTGRRSKRWALYCHEVPAGGSESSLTAREFAEWALVAIVTVTVWFGPAALHWICLVAMGGYILVRGPEWMKLWLVTILGTVLLTFGVIGGLVFLIG